MQKSGTIESATSELCLEFEEDDSNNSSTSNIKNVQASLNNIKDKLFKTLEILEAKISNDYDNYIKKITKQAKSIITSTEESIKDKEKQKLEFGKAFNSLEELYQSNLNFTNVVISAINNYNSYLSSDVPFYKDSSSFFLIKNSKELIDCNYFRKINQKDLNHLNKYIQSYNLLGDITNKYEIKTVYINSSKDSINGKCLLDSNVQPKINDLEISKIKDFDFNYLFEEFNSDEKKKIKKIGFNDCDFKNINLSSISYNIQNFILRNSEFSTNCLNTLKFGNLKYLSLEGINLLSDNFENLVEILFENDMGSKLKYLSVKNNYISRIISDTKLDDILDNGKKFEELIEINFADNNIYKVNEKFLEIIPKIKLINLINNNLNFFFKCKDIIENCNGTILLNKNISTISNNTFNDYYLDYYINRLNDNNNKNIFKNLNFEGLFNKLNQSSLLKLNLKTCFNINKIIEMNFSDNSIEDECMIKLFEDMLEFTNLEKLNLSNNQLTEKFLDKLINDKIFERCKYLKECDFSINNIKFKKDIIINLIKTIPGLETLIMKFTPLESKFNDYMKKKVIIYYENKYDKKKQTTKLDKEEEEINEIINNNFLEMNPFFKLKIRDLIKTKYTSKIKKNFPNLLDNIDLEEC